MNRTYLRILLAIPVLLVSLSVVPSQEEVRVAWQVTNFDINTSVQQPERMLNVTAVLNARNIGRGSGSTLTFRINSKASIKSVTVSGANANYRVVPETQGSIQRVTTTLPAAVPANGNVSLSVNYTLPVESNTGFAAISPIGSQLLPLSFWYPTPNTPFTVRGADTAPFRLTVNGPNVVSSGIERSSGGSTVYEQPLGAQPFFVQGEWDRIDGLAEAKGAIALIPKGASADERKQAEALIALAGAARTFYASILGPAPDLPLRLVAVRRGSGFHDGGTVLLETGALRRGKTDSSTALVIAESVAHVWVGGQTVIRGEGAGVLREGLTRYLATQFLEKQFGREAAQAELLRQRLSYIAVAKRDGPLSRATPLDDTYFNSVPNKSVMVWRLVEQRLGRDAFLTTLRTVLQAGKDTGATLAGLRSALVEKGGESLKATLDYQFDQVTDTDLMIGLPQQRGAEWVSALRNLGAVEVAVKVVATNDRGEQVAVETTVPARSFGEAVFKTTGKLVRAEIDPDKLYPQLDYANDVAPRLRGITETLAEASRFLSTQENSRAEATAREILAAAPQLQDARTILARALLAQNKVDEAEKSFRQTLDNPLPTPTAIAWANIGLGQIAMRKGQASEAAKRFNDAVRADADYATGVVARAERIRAEMVTNAVPVDESARGFVGQLDGAIKSGKKAELESRIVSGELVRFIGGIVGTQPEAWQTQVLRTEQVDATTLLADVSIQAKELGQERSGTALLVLSKAGGTWKLAGIELFEVR